MATQVVVFTNPWKDPSTQRSYRTGEVAELDTGVVFQLQRFGYVRTTDKLVIDPAEPYVTEGELLNYARWDTVNTAADHWWCVVSRAGVLPTTKVPLVLSGSGIVVPNPTPIAWAKMTMTTAPSGGPVTVRASYNGIPIGDITMPVGALTVTADWKMLIPAGAVVNIGVVEVPTSGAGGDIAVIIGGASVLP